MVAALVSDGGGLEKAILKKLERMGGELLLEQLGLPGGGSFGVFNLKSLMPKALELPGIQPVRVKTQFLRGLQQEFLGKKKKGRWRERSAWGRSNWATGRDDWLDNKWRHDWRSQPRDVFGKWVPGRLTTAAAALQYKGKKIGRRTKRRRKLRRLSRLRGRKAAKTSSIALSCASAAFCAAATPLCARLSI